MEIDRNFPNGAGNAVTGVGGPPRRNLDDVLCFKVGCNILAFIWPDMLTFMFVPFS
jgi:hypothetical protein